jgi:hypothetical protein
MILNIDVNAPLLGGWQLLFHLQINLILLVVKCAVIFEKADI